MKRIQNHFHGRGERRESHYSADDYRASLRSTLPKLGRVVPRRPNISPVGHAIAALFIAVFGVINLNAQVQIAWTAKYNNGLLTGTNQALKMALDRAGNIVVTGVSQNVNSNLDYVTIKFAANGTQLWASRYDSTNTLNATPAALAIDGSNNTVVTGTALTVRYDSNGTQRWTAPYAGTALATDNGGDVYVVGFDRTFGTVKLSPVGTNVWYNTYTQPYGPSVSEAVTVDIQSNIYVCGFSPVSDANFGFGNVPIDQIQTFKYSSTGTVLWSVSEADGGGPAITISQAPRVQHIAVTGWGGLYESCDAGTSGGAGMFTLAYSNNGASLWAEIPPNNPNGSSQSVGLVLDNQQNVVLAGTYAGNRYGLFKYNNASQVLLTNYYPSLTSSQQYPRVMGGVTVDGLGNLYVTGTSRATTASNSIVTIAYGPNGNQLWLQTYTAPSGGNAVGNAIAVDNSGSVYVAGYEDTGAGGTEYVLIKYSPIKLQKRADGSMLLQAMGYPGETFTIEASADLETWFGIGTATADTNGLMQFDDTNAPNIPARFYNTIPQ